MAVTGADREFAAVTAPYAPAVRKRLGELRALILRQAKALQGVGPVLEALRWGQFSFLTPETGSGSTVRIDGIKGSADGLALYFHCQSGLISQFRELYGGKLTFEGERAIVLSATAPLPRAELEHCISLALTHHLRKKKAHNADKGTVNAKASHHHRHRPRPG